MPLDYVIVPLAALGASVLTFLSGFGLGTLLMPVFALFFPVPLAIALTAVVHFLNNFFEMAFLYQHVQVKIALAFGLPAAAGAYGGAKLLGLLSGVPPLAAYNVLGIPAKITPMKLTVGLLILLFAVIEVVPRLRTISFDRRYVPLGGIVSGFFGGLSGHQGAPRAAFLIRTGLLKKSVRCHRCRSSYPHRPVAPLCICASLRSGRTRGPSAATRNRVCGSACGHRNRQPDYW